MSASRLGACQAMLLGSVGLMTIASAPAYAQSFCPGGFAQANGFCTNGATGAFSSAALSSSALTEVTTSVTNQAADSAGDKIRRRREEEARRPAAGGTPAAPRTAARPAAPAREAAPARRGRDVERVATPYYKAPPMDYGPRAAVWFQAFGDWEQFKFNTTTTNGLVLGTTNVPITADITRKITTCGFTAAYDWTRRNVAYGGDTLITGFLAGYMRAEATFDSTNISANTALVPNGSSTLRATVEGPSIGAFATYQIGGFSTDVAFKVDFLSINETFSELLGFGAVAGGAGPALVGIAGGGSTRALNYVTWGNVNYRFQTSMYTWWEPTAGFRFTYTDYDGSAAALGLTDGHVFRVQGGARFGADYQYYHIQVTPTFTALAYSDVDIKGGALQNGAFLGPAFIAHADEGKLRFQGIGAL